MWVTLARGADRCDTIGLGPGVLVPSLRHPMTNAAAIGTLVDLAIHELHLVGVNERDRALVGADLIAAMGGAYRPAELRDRLDALEAGGVTEVAYQPAGPDIPRELEAFAAAAG